VTAQRLQAPLLFQESVRELLSALARLSPDAAYWYARTAVSTSRLLA